MSADKGGRRLIGECLPKEIGRYLVTSLIIMTLRRRLWQKSEDEHGA